MKSFKGKTDNTQPLLLAVFILAFAMFLYLPKAAISVQESDGGELAAASVLNAVVHPSGYPLFLIFSRIIVNIFPSNPYHSVAMLAGIFQSFAAATLFLLCRKIAKSSFLAFSITLSWMLFEPVIRTATDAEVFSLTHFCSAVLVLWCIRMIQGKRGRWRDSFALGLLSGVGACNHHAIVLWAPLAATAIIVDGSSSLSAILKRVVFATLGCVIGLTPYLLLFSMNDSLVFPKIGSFYALLRHALRMDYGTFKMHLGSSPNEVSYLPHFIKTASYPLPLFLLSVPLLGIISIITKRPIHIGLFISALAHAWLGWNLRMPDFEPVFGEFIMRFYGILSLACAPCLAAIFPVLIKEKSVAPVIALFLLLPPLAGSLTSLKSGDHSLDLTTKYELDEILRELPQKGVFISSLDRISMGLLYRQKVLGERKDAYFIVASMLANRGYVKILMRDYPQLAKIFPKNPSNLKAVVDSLIHRGYVVSAYLETKPPSGYKPVPYGITWRWVPVDAEINPEHTIKRVLDMCLNLPNALSSAAYYRKQARYIVESIFAKPLFYSSSLTHSKELQTLLLRASGLLAIGKTDKAKRLCKTIKLSIERSKIPSN